MKYLLIVLSLVGLGIAFMFRTVDPTSLAENDADDRYSIRAKAYKAKRSLTGTYTNQLSPDGKPLKLKSKSKALELFQFKREKYYSELDCSQEELAARLDALNDDYHHMIDFAYQNEIQVEEIDYLSPELIFYLAFYSNKKPSDFGITDLNQINFTQEDWKYVKRFVYSKDFKILLYQNQLSMETSGPQELRELYMTNEDIDKDSILRTISSTENITANASVDVEIDFPELEEANNL